MAAPASGPARPSADRDIVETTTTSAPPTGVGYKSASESDLGKVWRCEKVRDFEWRARCLGLDKNPEAAELLRRMLRCTEELNEIGDALARGDAEPKWWLGGDYDARRAEECNDAGAESFKAKRFGEAFDRFTEAIRSWPSRPVYHANRASAALKLGRCEVAAADCEEALRLDPGSAKVAARCATALQRLGRYEQAGERWRQALACDPQSDKAAAGLRACRELEAQAERKRVEEAERSEAGTRTGLPIRGVDGDWGDRLYSLTEMLDRCGGQLSALLSVAEALIMCRRYPDAVRRLDEAEAAAGGRTSEIAYLRAEIAWRGNGDVEGALRILGGVPAGVDKCRKLREYLVVLRAEVEVARSALTEERFADAAEACERAERSVDPEACSGLFASLAETKATALLSRGLAREAAKALDPALDLEPHSVPLLLLRSRARRRLGNHHGALSDLSVLQSVDPAAPGVFQAMQKIARLILESKDPSIRAESAKIRMGFDPYSVLEVDPGSEGAAVRRAYRRLAARWHPDKWTTKKQEQREAAALRFEEVQKAYEVLTSDRDEDHGPWP